jgi:hypothetical protein
VLSISLIATGCSAQWMSVALADLPVLIQMALNISTIVTTLQSGQQISAAEAAAIQNISAQASNDLNLLATLYNEYKTNPSASALQKIQGVVADVDQNLPALLQAAYIGDLVLSTRVAASQSDPDYRGQFRGADATNLGATHGTKMAHQQVAIPKTSDLKKHWNQQLCGPTSNSSLDFSTTAARSDSTPIFRRPAATHASTCAGRAGGDFVLARRNPDLRIGDDCGSESSNSVPTIGESS